MPDGWTWYIPLHDGTASIGFVTGGERFARERQRTGTVEALYREALDRSAPVRELLEGARMRPGVRVDRDWSYASRSFAGPGHLLVGDAACFLDPLLSTGVHLATFAAMVASASVLSVRRGDVSEDDAFAFYSTAY